LAARALRQSTTGNGKLFIDYLSTVKRTMITSKMKKLKKELGRA